VFHLRDRVGLLHATQLNQQLLAAAGRQREIRGINGRWPGRLQLDLIRDRVVEISNAARDVELIQHVVAQPRLLVALPGLVQAVVAGDEIQLVVGSGSHPRVDVGVVDARVIEDGERLAMARRPGADCRGSGCKRDDGRSRDRRDGLLHLRSPSARIV